VIPPEENGGARPGNGTTRGGSDRAAHVGDNAEMSAPSLLRGAQRLARRFVDRWFPDRQVLVRTGGRVRARRLSQRAQVFAVLAIVGLVVWSGFATTVYVRSQSSRVDTAQALVGIRQAYYGLVKEVDSYCQKFASVTRDLDNNHAMLLALVEQNVALRQSVRQAREDLQEYQGERTSLKAEREILAHKLATLEGEVAELASRAKDLEEELGVTQSDLVAARSERNTAMVESRRLASQTHDLKTQLARFEEAHQQSVRQLGEQAVAAVAAIEQVIEGTGLDLERLFAAAGVPEEGQGGPFVAAPSDGEGGDSFASQMVQLESHSTRLVALQNVVQRMPLVPPLDSYSVTSGFGKRRDPINKKWAMHYGVDFGARKRAKVYATAPGMVTSAGWKAGYGRQVEIDHGAGLVTRYGHLSKVLVKKGQQVGIRDIIGRVGSTGRSTGPHLHYEILFDGRARNPLKFIRAGRHVFQK